MAEDEGKASEGSGMRLNDVSPRESENEIKVKARKEEEDDVEEKNGDIVEQGQKDDEEIEEEEDVVRKEEEGTIN